MLPTQMAFAPDGSIYVAEKNGTVRRVVNGAVLPTPVITLSNVNTYADRGLLGLALDPNFSSNGYLYLLYTYENTPGFNYEGKKTARLVRVTVVDGVASESSLAILLGRVGGDSVKPSCNDFAMGTDCIPSDSETHSGGGIIFGPDGKLYASLGDGAEFTFADPNARKALELDSLAGKIVRLNPDGTAPADNPFYNGNALANRSKVWTYGHRNTLRFSFRPSNGKLYSGDVGWYTWEEMNIGIRGANFGWPCREGKLPAPEYNCTTENYTDPVYVYDHSSGTGSAIGGVFAGSAYPADYAGSYFLGDYSQDNIRRFSMDANDNILAVETFIEGAGGPVDFKLGPDGSVYYIGIYNGDIRRIVHSSANRTPVAAAAGTPATGASAPLTVRFSSAGSSDPDGDTLSYLWTFGDGATSTAANPEHTYIREGIFTATLAVTDTKGASASASVTIRIGSVPSEVSPRHVRTTIDAMPTFIGRTALITSTIENRGTTGPVNVDIEIYNQSGTKVAQKVYEREPIAAGSSRDFTLSWFPPTVGTYRVAVGLFHEDWGGMYEWVNEALVINVEDRAPTTPIAPVHAGTVITPASVKVGTTADVQVSVRNGGGAGQALIDIEVYRGSEKVSQKFFDNEAFAAGETRTFGHLVTPDTAGDYRVAVGIFKPGWQEIYAWHNDVGYLTAESAATTSAPLSIFVSSLAPGWENWSWDTAVDFNATPGHNNPPSMKVTFASPWAGLYLHRSPFSLSGKSAINFSAMGVTAGGQQLKLFFFDEQGRALPAVNINSYISPMTTTRWSSINIPLADLGAAGKTVSGFALQGNDGRVQDTFLIDDITIR